MGLSHPGLSTSLFTPTSLYNHPVSLPFLVPSPLTPSIPPHSFFPSSKNPRRLFVLLSLSELISLSFFPIQTLPVSRSVLSPSWHPSLRLSGLREPFFFFLLPPAFVCSGVPLGSRSPFVPTALNTRHPQFRGVGTLFPSFPQGSPFPTAPPPFSVRYIFLSSHVGLFLPCFLRSPFSFPCSLPLLSAHVFLSLMSCFLCIHSSNWTHGGHCCPFFFVLHWILGPLFFSSPPAPVSFRPSSPIYFSAVFLFFTTTRTRPPLKPPRSAS